MKVETATHAKINFGRLLSDAKLEPIAIQKSGRNYAILMSYEEYERMVAIEDEYWALKAESAKKEGFVGVEESERFLKELLGAETQSVKKS